MRPDTFGQCRQCGEFYPVRETDDGLHPIGRGRECRCGSDEFVPVAAASAERSG